MLENTSIGVDVLARVQRLAHLKAATLLQELHCPAMRLGSRSMGAQPVARTRARTLLPACTRRAWRSKRQGWWHSPHASSRLESPFPESDRSWDRSWHLPQRLQAT